MSAIEHSAAQSPGMKRANLDPTARPQVAVTNAGGALLETPSTALPVAPGREAAAAAADLQARLEALEREATIDRLTGAWSRRYVDRALEPEIARSRRYRHPLSLAMIDIDRFKEVNDRFGHAAGDSVLKELATVVRETLRVADTLVRRGGEEFLVLMPYTTHRSAAIALERVRDRVAAHAFSIERNVKVSLGYAELLPQEQAQRLIERAERALYMAKETGRDRVCGKRVGASDAWAEEERDAVVQVIWRDRYACGHATIDDQHRELFRLANDVIAAAMRRTDKPDALAHALERCISHIGHHFRDEEQILGARGYPDLALHHALHRELLEHAEALRAGTDHAQAGVGALVQFLAHEVVARHLLTADKEYFYLFTKGADEAAPGARPDQDDAQRSST